MVALSKAFHKPHELIHNQICQKTVLVLVPVPVPGQVLESRSVDPLVIVWPGNNGHRSEKFNPSQASHNPIWPAY